MGLTLEAENRLTAVGLVEFYDASAPEWATVAQESYDFVKKQFPAGATIRRDDVALVMVPLLDVRESLTDCLKEKKCREKYWSRYFADLILDRTWGVISAPMPVMAIVPA